MNTDYAHFKNATPEEHIKIVRDQHGVCLGEPHRTIKGFFYHLASDALSTGVFLFSLELWRSFFLFLKRHKPRFCFR